MSESDLIENVERTSNTMILCRNGCIRQKKRISHRSFIGARRYARGLGLKTQREWLDFARGRMPETGTRPKDIPIQPKIVYRYHGWSGYDDWLGVAPNTKAGGRSFYQARIFARTLDLGNARQWNRYCRGELPGKGVKPAGIPASPDRAYMDKGWISWGDWLGYGAVEYRGKTYDAFTEARRFVRSLGLPSVYEWFDYCKTDLPENIPVFPYEVYRKNGWLGWNDWLGRKLPPTQERRYRGFNEARKFARSLRFPRQESWSRYCKGEIINIEPFPDDIPSCPDIVYAGEWISWGDWLGTGRIANSRRKFRPFREARNYVRSLGLPREFEWRKFYRGEMPSKGRIPRDIPTNPHKVYREEWKGMGDWLGTGWIATRNRKYLPFGKARIFARKLKIRNSHEWQARCRDLPADVPRNPEAVFYMKGWIGWGDWLGTGTVASARRKFLTFKEARKYARRLGLKSNSEWRKFCADKMHSKGKLPSDIPTNPQRSYKEEWISWMDFLGNETRSSADANISFQSAE